LWSEIGEKRAIEKTSQALREGQGSTKQKYFCRDNVEHSETEMTSITTGTSAKSSTTSPSHHANTNNLTSMKYDSVVENEYKREGYKAFKEEGVDTSALSQASQTIEKLSDEEEINHLIYQTFSNEKEYWLKHTPKVPSMNQISIRKAATSSQKEEHNKYSEKREHDNLDKVPSCTNSVRSDNDNTKHRRTEYSNILAQKSNLNSQSYIQKDGITCNLNLLFNSGSGNNNSLHTIQKLQDGTTTSTYTARNKNPVWYGGRSA